MSTATAFVLGFAGIILALGGPGARTETAFLVVGTTVLAGSMIAGVLCSAWLIRSHGGRRPLAAAFAGLAAGWVAGWVTGWVAGTVTGPVQLGALAQIVLNGGRVDPGDQARQRAPGPIRLSR